jgi:F0F1-type ATP synthase delta subunit
MVLLLQAGLLDKVETELTAITAITKKSPAFENFLSNPTIPRHQKTAQLSALLDEKQFSHISRNLFLTLSANGKAGDASESLLWLIFSDLVDFLTIFCLPHRQGNCHLS